MNDPIHILPALGSIQPQTWLLLGVAIIIGTLMMRQARNRGRSANPEASTRRRAEMHTNRLAEQARDDLGDLMLRLDELSREICGQIDTRFAKLEHVIREADAKLAALKAAGADPASPAPTSDVPPPADPRHAEIYERFRRGRSAAEIAREMSTPVGEIELILSLERNRRGDTAETAAPAAPETPAGPSFLDERA